MGIKKPIKNDRHIEAAESDQLKIVIGGTKGYLLVESSR